ncbi:MAG: type VII secretion protein EccB [Mycolicibacterium rufum]|nr:type VII secretion protein EccB [Mycolicibacterium rufum]
MRQPTTRLQVSGHRFLVRRMEHALVRGDAGMVDDPLRAQSLSLIAGAVLTGVAVAVCAVLALVRPAANVGDAAVIMVRESGALYVRVDGTLHPVANLTSAWLVAGNAAPPRTVSQEAVDRVRRGAQMGIPGAPQHISVPLPAESSWTVCDDGNATTVIAGPLAEGAVPPERGVLVRPLGAGAALTYLLYDGRRARVDLRHPAVVRALHLDHVEPQVVSPAVLAAIPEAPAIVPPHIPERGTAGPGRLRDRPVGSVVAVQAAGRGPDLFVVLAGGLQRIGEVAADLIRYTDARVGEEIPSVRPDLVGELPVVDTLPVSTYPDLAGVSRPSVVCARWQPALDETGSHTDVLVTDTVPVRDEAVTLAQADGAGPAVDAVAMPRGRSAFVQAVALGSGPDSVGPLFLLSDAGVLFGLENADTAARLGLPLPAGAAPWPVLAVLPRGPDLSVRAASTRRDVVAARP